ncbi:MAG: two-component sensor histidine kinase [Gammaproteobacteria bacterium]|nr:two-component sensor histidine kinase [Gammaproteobacteria bacterium]MBU1415389.1 two-component sensor histidine kinase [Gammaproteobacteria bacterium]
MNDIFGRKSSLRRLLPTAVLDDIGPALVRLLDAELAVLTKDGNPYWGDVPADAGREALVLESEPVGYLASSAAPERLRAAAVVLQLLLERDQALDRSETRYKELAEEFDQRVATEVQVIDERQRQIYQAEKLASVGQLAAGVAHEINNPIGFVRSNIATFGAYLTRLAQLKQRLGEAPVAWRELDLDMVLEDGTELVDDSLSGIDRVARIVRDLKGFSNVDRPEEEVVDLNVSINEACDVVAGQSRSDIAIVRSLGELPRLLCLPGHLKQVFFGIIKNGVQAVSDTGRPGTVTITSRAVSDGIEVIVADTGVGMTQDQQARAFEPFFTTREVGHGTGLGLTVARDIVQAHGGGIAIDSRPGAGTTVTVSLPA